ncbi:type 1 glutamine amidotransferase domain-containing protein [Congregibacter variabilis]|uniref:Type 1 glutamine amidotransferase domain-containing protein n=1 Tax=Congregibacter variabilis TaxID=3081200 RepID=A0ABZ0I7U2_9GAMM|nr:type 1 glutamine amidotransferase domain-containing protein [Congregibacter sp. IMCC43200]
MIKKILLGIALCVVCVTGLGFWVVSLMLPDESVDLTKTTPADLAYLDRSITHNRGKILAVVTSTAVMGDSGKRTGYELTELSRAYYVFSANGFTVDIASPMGGEPPVVIDDEDMGPFDYAFLNDADAMEKVRNTTPVDRVNPDEYAGVYFVGGKGAMWDFPENTAIQRIVRQLYEDDKVVAAVCHGPAALVNVKLGNGQYLLEGKQVSGFTNEEELFLISEARTIFPFLLEDGMRSRGATVETAAPYLEQVSQDGDLLTGQNPWSVWALAESTIEQLGYEPITRKHTGDEYSTAILGTFEQHGYGKARAHLRSLMGTSDSPVNHSLIAMHAVVAGMKMEVIKTFQLLLLASAAK